MDLNGQKNSLVQEMFGTHKGKAGRRTSQPCQPTVDEGKKRRMVKRGENQRTSRHQERWTKSAGHTKKFSRPKEYIHNSSAKGNAASYRAKTERMLEIVKKTQVRMCCGNVKP